MVQAHRTTTPGFQTSPGPSTSSFESPGSRTTLEHPKVEPGRRGEMKSIVAILKAVSSEYVVSICPQELGGDQMEGIILALLMNRQPLELDVKDCPALFPKKEVLIDTGLITGLAARKRQFTRAKREETNNGWLALLCLILALRLDAFPPLPLYM